MAHFADGITATHDLRLVALAASICAIGSFATLQMLARASTSSGRARLAWLLGGGGGFGITVWVTYFVAMLAYSPDTAIGFDPPLTLLALLVSVLGASLSLICTLSNRRLVNGVGGVLLGANMASMHFIGMQAVLVPGVLEYEAWGVAAAWAVGMILSPAALLRFADGRIIQAATLLVAAVCGLHFTAMAAVTIVPGNAPVTGVAKLSLALAIAMIGLLVITVCLAGVFADRHVQNHAARDSERFRRFADATFEGLFFLRHGIVTDANAAICHMLHRSASEIVGAPLPAFFMPESRAKLEAQGPNEVLELELVDSHGEPHVVDVLSRPLGTDDAAETVVAVRDASDRKRAERRFQELAYFDGLTGLANRLLLEDRLTQAVAAAERTANIIAVLCIDIDRFKEINDLFGHEAGDCLLIEVAFRLLGAVRQADTVGRLGGDEFIIIEPSPGNADHVEKLCRRLISVLSEPFTVNNAVIDLTVSIGIALFPNDGVNSVTLLKHADLALYRAKRDGRNGYRFFEPAMERRLRAHREMQQDLRSALTSGEMRLVYQPVFEADHLTLHGYEALLRWNSARRGAIAPSDFIPLAEECGAIIPIGLWVLETACQSAAGWSDPLCVAVNVSPAQLKHRPLVSEVSEILGRTGLPAERLELEVTEGVLIEDGERALAVLGALRAQGIRVVLDDFGTGYASLSYLRRFPFDRLKIDRSFVAELGTSENADAIVRAIIAMSQSLNLETTAEGVETEGQRDLLRAMGCGQLQGFLLGRPGEIGTPPVRAAATPAALACGPELAASPT